ncbi:MAG: sulfatase-like hydrolase/transferase [Planctomycetota bacterium]|jgi:arylsulfatase A-like enzyme
MDRPNILLFMADGMQARTLDPASPCLTPTMDSVVARGVWIRNANTVLPTCSPARASLMTGMLPHNHGVYTVEHCTDPDQCNLRPQYRHWAQALGDSGYETAYFGKWHVERSCDLKGFGWQVDQARGKEEHRKSSEGGNAVDERIDPDLLGTLPEGNGYNADIHYAVTDAPEEEREPYVTTQLAIDYLRHKDGEKPWVASVNFYGPNEAMIAQRKYFDRYDVGALPLPENLNDPMTDRAALYRRSQGVFKEIAPAEWRKALACYYARITEIDAQLGRLIEVLKETGQYENTLILITADHGKYVGSHGMEAQAHNFGAFEEIYNIPMVAAGPGVAAVGAVEARVGIQDVAPTLCEWTGSEPLGEVDGRSFAALLRDPVGEAEGFQQSYAEYHGTRFPARPTHRLGRHLEVCLQRLR